MINFIIYCGEFSLFSQLKLLEKNTFKTSYSEQKTKFKKKFKETRITDVFRALANI